MKKFSNIYRDQPDLPLERAVWWTEWLIRNPETSVYLTSPAVNHSFIVRESIDVILFLAFVVLITLLVIFKLFKLIFKQSSKNLKIKTN